MVIGAEQQIWTTWTLRDTNKVQTNSKVTDDVIILRSHRFNKTRQSHPVTFTEV